MRNKKTLAAHLAAQKKAWEQADAAPSFENAPIGKFQATVTKGTIELNKDDLPQINIFLKILRNK